MSDADWFAKTIEPKSDQLNADDLLTGPMVVTVTGWKRGSEATQPIDITLKECKPYRPCKSMRRVLAALWGKDPNEWIGRRMSLYCDPKVKFGGQSVGGIRISHMSDIQERGAELQLTETRGKRSPYRVECLKTDQRAADIKLVIESIRKHYAEQKDRAEMYAAWNVTDPRKPEQWTEETLAAAVEFAKNLEGN